MEKQFIQLTTLENEPIIIGLANVVTIETNPDNPNTTKITFNVPRNKDLWPKSIFVKEEFELVKKILGFKPEKKN